MISPITVATQGLFNTPLSVAAVRGRLIIVLDVQRGSDSSKPGLQAAVLTRQRILQEDEELLVIVTAAFGVINDN